MESLIERLKNTNIREWKLPDILKGITDAVKTTCKIHHLQQIGQIIQVQKDITRPKRNENQNDQVKTKKKRGRPKGKRNLVKG